MNRLPANSDLAFGPNTTVSDRIGDAWSDHWKTELFSRYESIVLERMSAVWAKNSKREAAWELICDACPDGGDVAGEGKSAREAADVRRVERAADTDLGGIKSTRTALQRIVVRYENDPDIMAAIEEAGSVLTQATSTLRDIKTMCTTTLAAIQRAGGDA